MHNKVEVTYFNKQVKLTTTTIVIPHYVETSKNPYEAITNYIVKTLNLNPDGLDLYNWQYTKDSEYYVSSKKVEPNISVTIPRKRELQEELESMVQQLYRYKGTQLDFHILKIKKTLEEYKRVSNMVER